MVFTRNSSLITGNRAKKMFLKTYPLKDFLYNITKDSIRTKANGNYLVGEIYTL